MESGDQGGGLTLAPEASVTQPVLVLPPSQYLRRTSLELPPGLSFEDWQQIVASLLACGTAVQWWLGDSLTYGEQAFGEKYAQAVGVSDQTGIPIDTIRKYQWVAERIPAARRRTDLTWSHHEAVASIEDAHAQSELLRIAAEKMLSVREMRESAKQIRHVLAPPKAGQPEPGAESSPESVGRPTGDTAELDPTSRSSLETSGAGWRPRMPSSEPDPADDQGAPPEPDHEPDAVAEWVRAEAENEQLRAQVALLTQNDTVRALSELSEKYARLEGRLQQALTTQGEAEKQAKYYSQLLDKIKKELGVTSLRDILAAIRARLTPA